jgi:Ca2+/Na+ antiporter
MDKKNIKDKELKGKVYFAIFCFLIAGGIIHKRAFNRPNFMMLWHLPAAVFLILSGKNLTQANRKKYYNNKKRPSA